MFDIDVRCYAIPSPRTDANSIRYLRVQGMYIDKFRVCSKVYLFDKIRLKEVEALSSKFIVIIEGQYVNNKFIRNNSNNIGLVAVSYEKKPARLKKMFTPWRIIKGPIKYKDTVFDFKWLIRVPTYGKDIVFLCDAESRFNVISLAWKLRLDTKFNKIKGYINIEGTPLKPLHSYIAYAHI